MDQQRLELAIKEAARFIDAGKKAHTRLSEDVGVHITGSKETAAARRASLDLTRALAELRRQ